MKIGIVGTGAVGAAAAMAVALRGRVADLILVNRSRARARAIAADIRYGAPTVTGVTNSSSRDTGGSSCRQRLAARLGRAATGGPPVRVTTWSST